MNQIKRIRMVSKMKNIFFVSFVCTSILLFASFGKSDSLNSASGIVFAEGNVPFVYPVIKTEDGKIYTVEGNKKIKEELLKTQGRKIEFTGKIISDSKNNSFRQSKDGFIEIERFKILN